MLVESQPDHITVPFTNEQMWAEFVAACGPIRKIDGHDVGTITYADFQVVLARVIHAERIRVKK